MRRLGISQFHLHQVRGELLIFLSNLVDNHVFSPVVKTTGGVYFQNFAQLRTTTAPIRPQGAYTVVSGKQL